MFLFNISKNSQETKFNIIKFIVLLYLCTFLPFIIKGQTDSLHIFKGEPKRLSPQQIATRYYPKSSVRDSVSIFYLSNLKLDTFKLTFPEFGLNLVLLLVQKNEKKNVFFYNVVNVHLLPARKDSSVIKSLIKKEKNIRRKLEKKLLKKLVHCKIFIQYKDSKGNNVRNLLGENKELNRIMIMINRKP